MDLVKFYTDQNNTINNNKKKNNHEKYITYILKIISHNYNVKKFKENLIIIRITET